MRPGRELKAEIFWETVIPIASGQRSVARSQSSCR